MEPDHGPDRRRTNLPELSLVPECPAIDLEFLFGDIMAGVLVADPNDAFANFQEVFFLPIESRDDVAFPLVKFHDIRWDVRFGALRTADQPGLGDVTVLCEPADPGFGRLASRIRPVPSVPSESVLSVVYGELDTRPVAVPGSVVHENLRILVGAVIPVGEIAVIEDGYDLTILHWRSAGTLGVTHVGDPGDR